MVCKERWSFARGLFVSNWEEMSFLTDQFSPLTNWVNGGWGVGSGVRDDSAEILYLSFLQEAAVTSTAIGRDVGSSMLSIKPSQH